MASNTTLPRDGAALPTTTASFTLSQIYGQVIYRKITEESHGPRKPLQKSLSGDEKFPRQSRKGNKQMLHAALRQANLSQPTWSRVMGGRAHLSFDKMKTICDALGLEFMGILAEVLQLANELQAHGYMDCSGTEPAHRREQNVNKDTLRFFIEHLATGVGTAGRVPRPQGAPSQ